MTFTRFSDNDRGKYSAILHPPIAESTPKKIRKVK